MNSERRSNFEQEDPHPEITSCGTPPFSRGNWLAHPPALWQTHDILRLVIAVSPARAKTTVVLFALAMIYGSMCSASCVAGVCPNLEHYSASHECDQPSHKHSNGPEGHGQHGPDCTQHVHPPEFALKAPGMGAFQVQGATVLKAGAVRASLSTPVAITEDIFQEFHRTPPSVDGQTLHQQVSVLRV